MPELTILLMRVMQHQQQAIHEVEVGGGEGREVGAVIGVDDAGCALLYSQKRLQIFLEEEAAPDVFSAPYGFEQSNSLHLTNVTGSGFETRVIR
jgi:hypothetical protein